MVPGACSFECLGVRTMKFADGMLRGFLGPFSFSTSSSVVDFLPVDPPLVAADLTGAAVAMVVAGVGRSWVADGLAAFKMYGQSDQNN